MGVILFVSCMSVFSEVWKISLMIACSKRFAGSKHRETVQIKFIPTCDIIKNNYIRGF